MKPDVALEHEQLSASKTRHAPPTLTVPSAALRTILAGLILIVGLVVILNGALTGVPLFVIAGIVVLGVWVRRSQPVFRGS